MLDNSKYFLSVKLPKTVSGLETKLSVMHSPYIKTVTMWWWRYYVMCSSITASYRFSVLAHFDNAREACTLQYSQNAL